MKKNIVLKKIKYLKFLVSFLRPHWRWVILAPVFMFFEAFMDLRLPSLLKKIVDAGIVMNRGDVVIKLSIEMLIISVLAFLSGAASTYFATKVSVDVSGQMREKLYKKVQSFSFETIDNYSTGTLITRFINDVDQVQRLIRMSLRIMLKIPFIIIGSITMSYITSPKLFIIVLTTGPFLIFSIYIVMNKSFDIYKKVQKNIDKVNDVFQENLLGIKTVKAFVRESFEEKRFYKVNEKLKNKMIEGGKIIAFEMPFIMLVMNISIVSVIYYGGHGVLAEKMKIGEVMAFVNYMQMMLMSLMFFSMLITVFSRSAASIVRIEELFSLDSYKEDGIFSKVRRGSIKFENVSFSYGENEMQLLKNISFEIEEGQTLAILGQTGSGKSTLINLICGFYNPRKGKISIDGRCIGEYTKEALAKSISLVFQKTFLFSGTLAENIAFEDNFNLDFIKRAAYISEAHEFAVDMSEAYETYLEERGSNLSGGQRQRISIARAIYDKAKILILDDSTSAVDLKTEFKIWENLRSLCSNPTIVVVAQRLSSVISADKIILMDKGEIIAQGKHVDLLKESPEYKKIYLSQFGGDSIE